MAGNNSTQGLETVTFTDNMSFDGTQRGGAMTTNGELWIGSTALRHVKKGTITSPDSSVTIGYSSPNITLTSALGTGRFPITPYVVGPVGKAGYQTIQSGLNAANAAGGGIVYVQPGTYIENLTLYSTTEVVGVPGNSDAGTTGNTTIITGVHTPPATGSFTFANVRLESATHIFNSAVAGSAGLVLLNVFIVVTNGFVFNLANWTGTFVTYNVGEGSTNNGMVNNTGGATCFFVSATHGAGTVNTMLTSGPVIMQEVDLNCPWSAATGTTISCDYDIFTHSVTCANNSTGSFNYCKFNTGATAALTMSSSAAISLLHSIVNTSNNPAIAGAGAGTLTYSDVVFLSNALFAGTLTLAKNSWQPYAVALAAGDGTKVGTCNFDSSTFAVSTAGFVTLTGGGGFTWNDVSGAFSPLKNNGYFITGTATGTLPASPSQGDTIKFFVDHASQVLTIDAPGTQIIRFGSLVSSAGGTFVSTLQGDSVELTYRTSDTCWCAIAGFTGTWTLT